MLLRQRDRIMATLRMYIDYAVQPDNIHNVDEAEECLEVLNQSWGEFTQIEDQLSLAPQQPTFRANFENGLFRAKTSAKAKLRAFNHNPNSTMNNTHASVPFEQYLHNSAADIRLPRISITPFGGNYNEWPSFCDIFETSIHNNQSLSKIHKFQYLKGYLTGDASALIRHIPVSNDNYDAAWQKLKDRYDNKKHIINTLIKLFVDQPSSSVATYNHLRQISDTTDEILRGLEPMGDHARSRDPWLIYLLLEKLDGDTRQQWAQKAENIESPSIDEFVKFLASRCNILESCEAVSKKPQPNRGSNILRTLHSTNTSICSYCSSSEHVTNHCATFNTLNVTDRRAFVTNNNLCYNCLRKGHRSNKCSSKNTCRICHKAHHTLLHLQPASSPLPSSSSSPSEHVEELIEQNQSNDS